MSHALTYVVGPSGVGKDSLLAWLLQRPHCDLPVPIHIARRSITRPEDGGTENHEPLTEKQFVNLRLVFKVHYRLLPRFRRQSNSISDSRE